MFEVDDKYIKSDDKSGSEYAREMIFGEQESKNAYKEMLSHDKAKVNLRGAKSNAKLLKQNDSVLDIGSNDISQTQKVYKVRGRKTKSGITENGKGLVVKENSVKNLVKSNVVGAVTDSDEGNFFTDTTNSAQRTRNTYKDFKAFKTWRGTKKGAKKGALSKSSKLRQKMSAYKKSITNKIKAGATAVKKSVVAIVKGLGSMVGGIAGGVGAAIAPVLGIVLAFVLLISAISAAIFGYSKSTEYGNLEGTCLNLCIFLREKGVDDVQIAAICGNVWGESGYRTNAIEYDNNGNELYGHGICQWSFGRWTQLQNWANYKGVDWTDENLQFEFLWAELTGEGEAARFTNIQINWKAFCDINNVDDATSEFCRQFERPANPVQPKRQEEAQRVYTQLTSKSTYGGNSDIVKRAYECLGKPYVWGGASDSGYDCSGLVSYAVTGKKQHTYNTNIIFTWTQVSEPQEGDILVTRSHCGVYIGNGKMIHAPMPGMVVEETSIDWFLNQGAKFVRYGG